MLPYLTFLKPGVQICPKHHKLGESILSQRGTKDAFWATKSNKFKKKFNNMSKMDERLYYNFLSVCVLFFSTKIKIKSNNNTFIIFGNNLSILEPNLAFVKSPWKHILNLEGLKAAKQLSQIIFTFKGGSRRITNLETPQNPILTRILRT